MNVIREILHHFDTVLQAEFACVGLWIEDFLATSDKIDVRFVRNLEIVER